MRRLLLTTALALLAALFSAPGASALYDIVEDGRTRLQLDGGLHRELREEGVRVRAAGPGDLAGRVVALPVVGGQIDPAGASGTLSQRGGIRLSAGGRSVKLTDLGIHTGEERLSARVGGKRIPLARTDGFSFRRVGFGNAFKLAELPLRARAARLLNRRLGLEGVFRAGRSLGSIAATTRPAKTKISGGEIVFAGAEGFFAKLHSIGIEARGFETTPDGAPTPTFRFAIVHGDVGVDMLSGFAFPSSGLRIMPISSPQSPTMLISSMGIDLETAGFGSSPFIQDGTGQPLPGGGGGMATLDLTAAVRTIDPEARTMTLSTVPAAITAAFADRLNEHYAQPRGRPGLFLAGEPLGTVAVSLKAH